jgi:hypothetical protein
MTMVCTSLINLSKIWTKSSGMATYKMQKKMDHLIIQNFIIRKEKVIVHLLQVWLKSVEITRVIRNQVFSTLPLFAVLD